jgi:hypothetical protein
MVATWEQTRAIERPEVGDLLDHAQALGVAARIGADVARV